METKKKTPYQLDLEVKDRKPDITPKVGDWVKIKSREWYKTWMIVTGDVLVNYCFTSHMEKYCGRICQIREVGSSDYFLLKDNEWSWSMEMFEEVYPQEEYTVHKSYFGDIVVPIAKGSTAMEAIKNKEGHTSLERSSNHLLGVDIHQVLSKTIPATIPSIDDLGKQSGMVSGVVPGLALHLQSKQGASMYVQSPSWMPSLFQPAKERDESERQKLKIIKTNHLIKVKKL